MGDLGLHHMDMVVIYLIVCLVLLVNGGVFALKSNNTTVMGKYYIDDIYIRNMNNGDDHRRYNLFVNHRIDHTQRLGSKRSNEIIMVKG